MIDWFRGEILFDHLPIPVGRVISIESDGSVAWECLKTIQLRDSWETSLKIKSTGIRVGENGSMVNALQVDGNLCKFLQGHNIFGSRDINQLLFLAFRRICAVMSDHFHGHDLQIKRASTLIQQGEYKVTMIDINQLYDCGNDLSVEQWLHAAEMRAKCRSGKASRDKGTVYLAKTSKRWAFKFYNKHREINASKKHRLPEELNGTGLESFVVGKLRAELRLFGKEMEERHGITQGKHLTPDII